MNQICHYYIDSKKKFEQKNTNMKKSILLLFLLTSCSLNNDSAYWNENLNINYEELKYDKDYTFDEYGKILESYSLKNTTPKIN